MLYANSNISLAIISAIPLILYGTFFFKVTKFNINPLKKHNSNNNPLNEKNSLENDYNDDYDNNYNNDYNNNDYDDNNFSENIQIAKDGSPNLMDINNIVNNNINKLRNILKEMDNRWNAGTISKLKLAYSVEFNGEYKNDANRYLSYISGQLKHLDHIFTIYKTHDGRSYYAPDYLHYLIYEVMGKNNTPAKLKESSEILEQFAREFNSYMKTKNISGEDSAIFGES